jgi:hypothetical protein
MSRHAEKLRLQRQALVTKSQAERILLVLHGQQLKQSLAFVDMGIQIVGKLAQSPIIGLSVLIVSIIIKPRRIVPLLKKALSTWQIWQMLAPSLNKIKKAAAPTSQE